MKRYILGVFLGLSLGVFLSACAGIPRQKIKFPNRSDSFSVWSKCTDGDEKNVCKYYCSKYKNGRCKKGHKMMRRAPIKKLLDNGSVIMSKELWINILKDSH